MEIFVKLNTTILEKNLKQIYIFRTKLAISPKNVVPADVLSIVTYLKKKIADKHTDRIFASRTNIPQAVAGLYLKCIYFRKKNILLGLI